MGGVRSLSLLCAFSGRVIINPRIPYNAGTERVGFFLTDQENIACLAPSAERRDAVRRAASRARAGSPLRAARPAATFLHTGRMRGELQFTDNVLVRRTFLHTGDGVD